MKKIYFLTAFSLILWFGCARVRVEAPKEPIRVDISMRLDVYQHVAKDIDDIESIVSGTSPSLQPQGRQGLFDYFIPSAYAQGLSPQVEQAALRRRDRHEQLVSLQERGILGEDRNGLLQIRDRQAAPATTEQLINAENQDRMLIYKAIAERNNTSLAGVQEMYAKRLQQDAPRGAPIEVFNVQSGRDEWQAKK